MLADLIIKAAEENVEACAGDECELMGMFLGSGLEISENTFSMLLHSSCEMVYLNS